MGKVIAIASGKGGTGKTTTAAAVSSCLAALGHKTLCIDFDAGLKNLDLALCIADAKAANFLDVADSRQDLLEACHKHPRIANLFFLSAPMNCDPSEFDIMEIIPMFTEIRREFEYCIIDTPSGIGAGFRLAHADADMSIIVTTGETPSIRAAQRTVMEARSMGVVELRLLVNRVMPNKFKYIQSTIDDLIDTVGARLIGVIPEDKAVFRALHGNTPLMLYQKRCAAVCFLDTARRITGEPVPLRIHKKRLRVVDSRVDPDSKYSIILPKNLIGSYGDPEFWVQPTMAPSGAGNLVKIYEVSIDRDVASSETIRNRMWLHDMLDDRDIPYHIEMVGFWAGRKKYTEAQHIYVEDKHRIEARRLIREYNNPANFVREEAHASGAAIAEAPEACVLVYSSEKGQVIWQKGNKAQRYRGGLGLPMLLYYLLDLIEKGELSWDDEVTANDYAAKEAAHTNSLGLALNEKVRLQTLFQAAVINSSPDAAMALSGHIFAVIGEAKNRTVPALRRIGVDLGIPESAIKNITGRYYDRNPQYFTPEMLLKIAEMLFSFDKKNMLAQKNLSYKGKYFEVDRVFNTPPISRCFYFSVGLSENTVCLCKSGSETLLVAVCGAKSSFERDQLLLEALRRIRLNI
jgi:septum site-determining protein MinD